MGKPKGRVNRRAKLLAFAASILVHAIALSARFEVQVDPRTGPAAQASRRASPAMRVYNIAAVREGVPTPEVIQQVVVEPRSAITAPGLASGGGAPRVVGPVTPGKDPAPLSTRIAPRVTDARLWSAPVPSEVAADEEAKRIRAPVADAIEALNDSIADAAEAERRANDWTIRDEEGSRWGISPDRIHIAGKTVQLRYCTVEPCPGWLIPTPPARRDEYASRLRGFAEIRRQASQARLDSIIAERTHAIRARAETRRDTMRSMEATHEW